MNTQARNGATLVVVSGLMVLGTLVASTVALSTGTRMCQVRKQIDMEAAFCIAEAGAEHAASRIAAGNETAGVISGSLSNGSYVASITVQPSGMATHFDIVSTGTVQQATRVVSMRGIRGVSWARYALWYNTEATTLNMFPGERFDGRVYSRPQLHFSNTGLPSLPQVRFTERVWSMAPDISKSSAAVQPIFDQGLTLNARMETIPSVIFADLQSQAGLVLDGPTTITVSNATLWITNTRKGWTTPRSNPIPSNGVVYVRTATSGTSPTGDITVSAPNGLAGRLTLVSENDIKITGHIVYRNNPTNNPSSTDAMGLIARRDVSVQTTAPANLNIYAHIICQTGGFGVVNYTSRTGCGTMTVYGGIVNSVRKAVNQNGGGAHGTGYAKNYIFDQRFTDNPPPCYPNVPGQLEWTSWEG